MGQTIPSNADVTNKLTSMEYCSKLVRGYIQNIGHHQFIPQSIIDLCLRFYHPLTIMLWLNHSPPNTTTNSNTDFVPFYITDIYDSNKLWKCSNIVNVHSQSSSTHPHPHVQWNMRCNSCCFVRNINHCFLPSQITQTINDNAARSYHVLFKSEGLLETSPVNASDACNAIVINEDALRKPNNQYSAEISCMNWALPHFARPIYGNFLVYSNVYGLLSIGGIVDGLYMSAFYNLNFDHIRLEHHAESTQWTWQSLPSMHLNRYLPSSVMIDYDKAIVVGGYNPSHHFLDSVEIFDFGTQKWSLANSVYDARNQCGIYYDNTWQKVYVGGGRFDQFTAMQRHDFEWFDVATDKWLHDIPNTNHSHGGYPQIWKDAENVNILCIASTTNDCLEFIDLRVHNKAWNVLYGPQKPMTLSQRFGVHVNSTHPRLLTEFCRLCM